MVVNIQCKPTNLISNHVSLTFQKKKLSSKLHTKMYSALWDMHTSLYDPIPQI